MEQDTINKMAAGALKSSIGLPPSKIRQDTIVASTAIKPIMVAKSILLSQMCWFQVMDDSSLVDLLLVFNDLFHNTLRRIFDDDLIVIG
jgi:hypothetical protein